MKMLMRFFFLCLYGICLPLLSQNEQSATKKNGELISRAMQLGDRAIYSAFKKYNVSVTEVRVDPGSKHLVFEVDIPFDPQSSPNQERLYDLCYEVLRANHYVGYFLNDKEDNISIDVSWNKVGNVMSVNIEELSY
jgi:hypothetical protein